MSTDTSLDRIRTSLAATQRVAQDMLGQASLHEALLRAVALCVEALRQRRRVFFAGNGGSAAEAQHFAAELLGRYLIDRAPLPAMALHVDTSALTAIGMTSALTRSSRVSFRDLGSPAMCSWRSRPRAAPGMCWPPCRLHAPSESPPSP